MQPIPVGTLVIYRRGWASGRIYEARVASVELSDTDEFIYTLDDGHWCYAGQIIEGNVGTDMAYI